LGGLPLREVLEYCEKNGIMHVEFSAPHPVQSFESIRELFREYKEKGFQFILHNYFPPQEEDFVLNISSKDSTILDLSRQLVSDSEKLARVAEAPVYAIHAGYLADACAQPDGMFKFNKTKNKYSECLDAAAKFINSIIQEFDNQKVALALENLFPGKDKYALFCSIDEIKEMMSLMPPQVGLLLDLGHLNISANLMGFNKFKFIDKYLSEFGDRLYEVHCSENKGEKDEHLPLEKGSWQLEVLKEIDTIAMNRDFSRVYCLEARNSIGLGQIQQSMRLIEDSLIGVEIL